ERFASRFCAINQLRQVNGTGLLPHDEGRDGTGALASPGPDHFGPPGTLHPVRSCAGFGFVEMLQVPGHAALQQLRVPPKREVALMPEVHLEVELAVP